MPNSTILRIDVLGGIDIGASSALAEAVDREGQHRFMMIDCGIGFAEKNGKMPVPLEPRVAPDLIILTHAHSDHSMLAPRYLAKYGSKVLMTGPTFYTLVGPRSRGKSPKRELPFLMLDHLKVSEMNKRTPAFTYAEYVNFVQSEKVELVYHTDWMEIFPGVEIKFYPNGHIRGSASILIKTDEKKVMFSGDISVNDTPTVLGMIPPTDFQPDVLFLESTNGISPLPDRETEVRRLVETAGKFRYALIPAFGVGRSPDVILDIAKHNFPAFLDGMGKRMLLAYMQEEFFWCENDLPIPKNLLNRIRFVRGQKERESLIRDFNPKAVVTTGGMMNGPAMAYAERWLNFSDAAVLEVGYAAEGTPAEKLLKSMETGMPFEIREGQSIKVQAHVERFRLSAHIGGPQNVELAKAIRPKKIYLVHGEPESRAALARVLNREGLNAESLNL